MATKKTSLFGTKLKKADSNVKSSTSKAGFGKTGTKPMKDCGCGGKHGK
jgi:hypothetical protein